MWWPSRRWPLTHMKNPIIYNQTPKFKDLTFKIPISVQYKKSPASSFSKSHPPLLHHHSSTTIILHRPTQDPPINLCPGDDCRLRWLRRTIQLRRHLVASRLGNDGHTSTKKSSLSLKTRVNKKHLRQRCWWWCRQSHDRVTSKRFDKRSTTILPRGKTKQEHRETKRGTLEWCLLARHQIRRCRDDDFASSNDDTPFRFLLSKVHQLPSTPVVECRGGTCACRYSFWKSLENIFLRCCTRP